MRRLILPLLILACCPSDRVTQYGTPAPHADLVIAAAENRCDLHCTEITWEPEPFHAGYDEARLYSETTGWDACGAREHVWAEDGAEAWDTELAHGLGHYCLRTYTDEGAADGWAAEVNAEAKAAYRASAPP